MLLFRKAHPTEEYADGIAAPLVRAAGHLGYCVRLLSATEESGWEEAREEIRQELNEVLAHLNPPEGENPFISGRAKKALETFKEDSNTLLFEEEDDLKATMTNLQTLMHNAAYVAALAEMDNTGWTATPGSKL